MVKTFTVLSLVASAFFTSVSAAPRTDDAPIVPGAYIVEFEEGQDESAFYNDLGSSAIEATPRLSLSYDLFKGASFRLENTTNEQDTALRIASSPVVKKLWPVRLISLPKDEILWTANEAPEAMPVTTSKRQEQADTFSPHVMTQVDKLRADGVTGKGLKVAVIDTGIDYLHPALGGGFGPGFLVSYGTDLVGDNYDGTNTPVPDDDPIDECEGHGTHVAGIVAAQENPFGFTGTAPGVTLGAYRVFGCGGSAGNDVLIAAYNQAYQDGSDIITASIGGPSGWSEDPWAVAVQRIVEAGVPCTISAGNAGATGQFYASTAANGKGVTAIASVDNTQAPNVLLNATYTSATADDSFGWAAGSPADWGNVSLPLYAVTLNTAIPNDACSPLPDSTPDLSGYIVLVRRGTCTYVQKLNNVAAKGAKYVMFYNNVAGTVSVSGAGTPVQAVGMVQREQGAEWIELLSAGTEVTLNIIDPKSASTFVVSSPNTLTGGFLSTYTSWGPTWEADVKPQLSAPGGIILSTFPRALGAYAILSGTSMACPQAAGVVALIGEVRGTLDPKTIENLLAATANPNLFHDGRQAYDFLAPVQQQGAGLLQAYDAAHSTTLLSVSSLAFNDTDNLVKETSFTIKNSGYSEVSYDLATVNSNTAYTLAADSIEPAIFPNEFSGAGATLSFDSTTVSVAPGEEKTVKVSVSLPYGLDGTRLPVYSGYITLNATNGESLSLPYMGVAGSLHDATVLDTAASSIFLSNDASQTPIGNDTTFTFPQNGTAEAYPVIAPVLALGSRLVYADVIPAEGGGYGYGNSSANATSIGQVFAFPLEYNTRGLLAVGWDGLLGDQSYAPAGSYSILVRALKIFGDVSKAKDFEQWSSPVFTIEYS